MILLASRSPQRAWLLARAGFAFRVVTALVDEDQIQASTPEGLAKARARAKAESTQEAAGVVLGSDTVVALGPRVFGSPRDRAEARAILTALGGTTHQVITGHCLCRIEQGNVVERHELLAQTLVTMRPLQAQEIDAYVASGESDGRAGAYAIQEHGDRFVTRLDGAWDAVVGLSISCVRTLHRQLTGADPEPA